MATGLGAFLKGAVEGYDAGIDQARKNKKAKREEAQFELEKQKAQLEIDAKQREADYQNDMKKSLAELQQGARGSVSGEVVDEMTGENLGKMTYAPGQAPNAGLRFREGTVIENKPMDPIDYQFRVADTLKAVAARHGKLDLKMLDESRKFGQKIRAEGAVEAMKYFMATQDQDGAKKMFNERGGIKIGDDIQFGVKDGLFGPVMYGYRVDKDGKQVEAFDGFRDVILPSMSPEAYTATMAQFAQTAAKEKGDTFRTGMTTQATLTAAQIKANAERDAAIAKANAAGQLTPKDKLEMISKRVSENLKAVFTNAGAALDADRRRAIESEIGMLAEQMIMKDPRVGVEQAANAASDAVYKKYGIVTKK